MKYSNFYKKWIATCVRCHEATLNFNTYCNNQKLKTVSRKKFYNLNILNEYFEISEDFHEIRSNCTQCFNKNCKAFMKNQ